VVRSGLGNRSVGINWDMVTASSMVWSRVVYGWRGMVNWWRSGLVHWRWSRFVHWRSRSMVRSRCMMRSWSMIRSRVMVWIHCCSFICYFCNITAMVVGMVVDRLGTAIG